MKLNKKRIRRSKFYGIGYIPCIEKYVMYCVIKCNSWYDRYYEITEDEYVLYKNKPCQLDKIAEELFEKGDKSERFLFSENESENTEEQTEMLSECRKNEEFIKNKYIYF